MLERACADTALRRVDNQNLTLHISAYNMKMLKSIVSTLESIKKKHTSFKIKIDSIELENFDDSEYANLVEI